MLIDLRRGEKVEVRAATVEDLNKCVEKLWQLDSFPRDDSESKLTMDEIAAVKSMEKNLKYDKETGRFQTRLLWKGKPDLAPVHLVYEFFGKVQNFQ